MQCSISLNGKKARSERIKVGGMKHSGNLDMYKRKVRVC